MFQRILLIPPMAIFRSTLLSDLGVPHAFTNSGWDVTGPSSATAVLNQLRRHNHWPARRDGLTPTPGEFLTLTDQTHGNQVTTPKITPGSTPTPKADGWHPSSPPKPADAHVTHLPDHTVAVRTADCVPILLAASDGRTVAAVHAGWRGLDPAVHIIAHTLDHLQRLAPQEQHWHAAVGPCISAAHYPVGPEVAARFRNYPGALTPPPMPTDGIRRPPNPNPKPNPAPNPHLDCRAVAAAQLRDLGLSPNRIDVFPGCTFADAHEFHSYRRQGPGVGHQAALITPAH
jgi:YfiH family protein